MTLHLYSIRSQLHFTWNFTYLPLPLVKDHQLTPIFSNTFYVNTFPPPGLPEWQTNKIIAASVPYRPRRRVLAAKTSNTVQWSARRQIGELPHLSVCRYLDIM